MFNSNTNDCESIDFDFFESKDHVKLYGELNQCASSKIVTKAVIETNPSNLVEFEGNLQTSSYFYRKRNYNEDTDHSKFHNYDFVSSPSSSLEKKFMDSESLDESLLNCLAYNDDYFENQELRSLLSEDKECSNNSLSDKSLSDSTITTVTSDFTSVSLFSCLSDSSSVADTSLDSSIPQNDNENNCDVYVEKVIHNLNELEDFNTDHEDNNLENVGNQSLSNKNGFLENETYTEIKENQSLNGECSNNDINYEDVLENHSNETSDQSTDNEDDVGSEQLHGSIEHYEGIPHEDDNFVKEPFSVNNDCENSNGSVCYESDYESESLKENGCTSDKNSNISVLEEELGDISLATEHSSKSHSIRSPLCRGSSKIRVRRKECNLSFSREELIKIERDNLTLLKKIMAHAKPRTVALNQPFSHKKTSAAINRAKQQKKIDQDNYILYSKISSMGRMKRIF